MKRRAVYGGFIVLVCVLWGLGNPVIKLAGEALPPFWSVALRFLVATAAFALLFGRRVLRALRGVRWLPMLAVCVCTGLAFMTGSFALMMTDAVVAGFLMGISVLFTPFLEPLILRARFRWRVLPLVAVVCAGMYLLCGGGTFQFGLGEALAVLCSLLFALMLTLSEKYIGGMDDIALSAMQCAVSAVLATACALAMEGVFDLRTVTWEGAGAVLYLALGSTCAAYILQNKAIRHIPATFASLAYCTEPLFTAVFSYLLLGERLPPLGLAGGGLILAGVVAASAMKE